MKYLIALLLLVSIGFAQDGSKPQLKKVDVRGVDEKAPVTKSEASAIFARARRVIKYTRIANVGAKSSIQPTSKPVTREEVVLELATILDQSKASIKLVPKRVRFDPKELNINSAKAKAALQKLIAWGFVAPVGPLATGGQSLSTADFGETVGFFLSRLTDVTHMPSIKWSPYLQSNS